LEFEVYIDTHCHLDLYPSPESTARDASIRGVTIIAVTNLPSHFRLGRPHVQGLRNVRLAVGLHPLMARRHVNERQLFESNLDHTSYVGEVGLDFSREGAATRSEQLKSFEFVLERVAMRPRFVSLHSRRAELEVIRLLERYRPAAPVFHWYSGPIAYIERALACGAYFSINPAMFASSHGQRVIREVPQERILLESDGPHVQIDQNTVLPGQFAAMVTELSTVWNTQVAKVNKVLDTNFRTMIAPIKVWSEGKSSTMDESSRV
jgi:TatD DNase family protein